MATLTKRGLCTRAGCRHVQPCPDHTGKDTSRKVYNSRRWRRVRALVLQRDVLCQLGLDGCTIEPTEVDHIAPISTGGEPYHLDNLRGVCKRCHATKTAGQ